MTTFAVLAANIGAQQVSPPQTIAAVSGTTVAECTQDASRWYDQYYKVSSDSVQKGESKFIDLSALAARRADQLRACLSRLDQSSVPPSDLMVFAERRADARDYDGALSLTKRFISAENLSDSARVAALRSMLARFRYGDASVRRNVEPYLQLIDAMPASVTLQKLETHMEMFRDLRARGDDEASYAHASAFLRYARDVKAHLITKKEPTVPSGMIDAHRLREVYLAAAVIDGNFGREQDGARLLARAAQDHPEVDAKFFASSAAAVLRHFAMVGKPAPTVESTRWFNAPAGTKSVDFRDRVTVLGFTAHWCPPCHLSYKPLQAIADSMSGYGVQVMFATEFYSFVGATRTLNEQDEMRATREYYDARKITFPIAMLGEPVTDPKARRVVGKALSDYGVGQLPQTMIIDRRGIVRRVLIGWDPANNERIPAYLHALVREK